MNMKPHVAIIGVGNMGSAFLDRLLGQGYPTTLYNRTRQKVLPYEAKGAKIARTLSEALMASELVIVGLFDAAIIREVLLVDRVRSLLQSRRMMIIAHTSPTEIRQLASDFAAAGASLSEVSVVAYPDTVRAGTADFVLAGPKTDFENAWREVFKDLSSNVHHMGEVGNASKAEMALWLPYAFQTIAVAYAVAAFRREKLSSAVLASILTTNPILRIAGADVAMRDMVKRTYGNQQWSVSNFIASLKMTIDYAGHLGLPVQVFEAINAVYAAASDLGLGGRDVAAVYEAVDRNSAA